LGPFEKFFNGFALNIIGQKREEKIREEKIREDKRR